MLIQPCVFFYILMHLAYKTLCFHVFMNKLIKLYVVLIELTTEQHRNSSEFNFSADNPQIIRRFRRSSADNPQIASGFRGCLAEVKKVYKTVFFCNFHDNRL